MSILDILKFFLVFGGVGFTLYCVLKFLKGFIKGYRGKH